MELPTYTNADREQRYKDKVDVQKNTLLKSNWDKATYQVVAANDTHIVTDNGETIVYSDLHRSIEQNSVEIIGQRATN